LTPQPERSRIATLPQSVADRIAAGEVVERPAAVIKELIENSLDSGALKITVQVVDAGRTLLKVVDDGSGMTGSELAASIGRHATSKLKRFEDLESLHTFGFRGEALPSIAAVSRLDVVSRARGEEIGARLTVSGGVVEQIVPVACPEGTSITVGHLFHNVPARRKFLRSDSTEFKWIALVFKHFALAFPEVSFEFFRGEEQIYNLPAGEWRQRVGGLFGDDVAEEVIQIDYQPDWLRVRGWIAPPHMAQRTPTDQFLFINRRPITSSRLNHAIHRGAEPYLTSGGHLLYGVMLECDPAQFDINVHPAKKEVKFADENAAYGTVFNAVRSSVGAALQPSGLPGAEQPTQSATSGSGQYGSSFNQPRSERSPVPAPDHLTPFTPIPRRHFAPSGPLMPFPGDKERHSDSPAAPNLFDPHSAEDRLQAHRLAESNGETSRPSADAVPRESEGGPVVWQAFDTYIVSPLKTGLVFIDQHVAHERVLYERGLASMEKTPWVSQQLLFPTSLQVSPEDVAMVEEMIPLLRAMGFEVERFGPREFRILSVPAAVRISGERQMMLGIIDEMREGSATGSDPRHRLAAAFACRGAVKAGQPLERAEMLRLIEELFQCEDPEFCPHGRPIYHVLNRREIEKWFKR